jgi:hypothetical protein
MPDPIRPVFARHGTWVPTEDGKLNVTLPGELVESHVLQVHGRNHAVVELAVYFDRQGQKKQGAILGKSGHNHRPGDILPVERAVDDMGVEIWKPVDERQFRALENAERLATELSRAPKPEPEPAELSEVAAPEIGSGPAAAPEIPEPVGPPSTLDLW